MKMQLNQLIIISGLAVGLFNPLAALAGNERELRFERLFPALSQPWYFSRVNGVALDPEGYVLVADAFNEVLYRFTTQGQIVNLKRHGLGPSALHVDDSGRTYSIRIDCCPLARSIGQYGPEGELLAQWPTGDGHNDGGQRDDLLTGNAAGTELYFFNRESGQVQRHMTETGAIAAAWTPQESNLRHLFFDDAGGQIWAVGDDAPVVRRYQPDGVLLGEVTGPGALATIALDECGTVYGVGLFGGLFRFARAATNVGAVVADLALSLSRDLAIDGCAELYVATTERIDRFTRDGVPLQTWTANVRAPGFFEKPAAVALGDDEQIWVLDEGLRVQRFASSGAFISEWTVGCGSKLATGPGQPIYVAGCGQLDMYDTTGQLQQSVPLDPNYFVEALQLSPAGQLYVLEVILSAESSRVLRRDGNGDFETFADMAGRASDIWITPTQVFVSQATNPAVRIFDLATGALIEELLTGCCGLSQLGLSLTPSRIAVDSAGTIFSSQFRMLAVDNNRQARVLAEAGVFPSQVSGNPFADLAVGPQSDRLVVADRDHARVQVFNNTAVSGNSRAIIVAAGGPYPGNALWEATQSNANFAFRALAQQGFTKASIQYLSDDTQLDLDQNGSADDVDATVTAANLQAAIGGPFAESADRLLVYLVDHGGENTFRLSGAETLDAATLGGWLDAWQSNHPTAGVTVVYDACQSGSFLDELRSEQFDRVVIASSAATENAYFVSQGTLSFSSHFWTHIFNGLPLADAFSLASATQSMSFPEQNPQVDADGDGASNTAADLALLQNRFIGNGISSFGDAPQIGSVTPAQTIVSGNSAAIRAENVTDDTRLARVWTVVRPPGFNPGSADNPISDLPTFDLLSVGGDAYEASYDGFSDPGTYQLTVYAADLVGNTSVPRVTAVSVDNPLARKAIVVVGGAVGDDGFAARAINADRSYRALEQQGYGTEEAQCAGAGLCDQTCDNVCYLTAAGTFGFDVAPSQVNVQAAIEQWGSNNVQDLTLYLIAAESGNGYALGGGEGLSAGALKGHLDAARAAIPGKLTVIVEGDDSQTFIEQLALAGDSDRILIASAGNGEEAVSLLDGAVSFSAFFWNQVLNGATVRNAFNLARSAIRFNDGAATPRLDDNGNGVTNEFSDGATAGRYTIGNGVLLAGDDPLVGTIAVGTPLTGDFESILAGNVTTTGSIKAVSAIVTRPDGSRVTERLQRRGTGYSAVSYGLCSEAGNYAISVYATDDDGATSLPATQTTSRAIECSEFRFYSGFE